MPTAVITGASAGLGRALAVALAARGWRLVVDARRRARLATLPDDPAVTQRGGRVHAVAGDVAVESHRAEIVAAAARLGGIDLLVNNASTLGPTPLRPLARLTPTELAGILAVNLTAPFALITASLPVLRAGAAVIDISSDAAVENYPTWGGYGASKAALDHLTATFAVENPEISWYSLDPGDMDTEMQQAAFPGEDISDRRRPADVVPAVLDLIDRRPPSGRYRAGPGVAEPARAEPAVPMPAPTTSGAAR